MRIAINGALGKMGRELEKAILEGKTHELAYLADKNQPLCEFSGDCDMLIDFSSPEALKTLLGFCRDKKIPLVMGTTALKESDRAEILRASSEIPILYSENMSLGINLMNAFLKKLALELKGAEIEIIETHHDQKKDAPSGTALFLAREMQGQREGCKIVEGVREKKSDIAIHSLRLGREKGTHSVIFSSELERLEITHVAGDRRLFALGAIRAAEFLLSKAPGLYSMEDVFKA